MEDAVEARFVAVEEAELGLGRQGGKGLGDLRSLAEFGVLGGDGIVHEFRFNGPGAALTPEGRQHFLDKSDFDAVGGIEAFRETGREDVKALARFGFENDTTREQPVADGIGGRALLAGLGDRPLGPCSVGARGHFSP